MWGQVLAKLEKRINRSSFNTWLRPTSFLSVDQKAVHIGVPDEVFVYWLGEHYVNVIRETLTDILGFQPEIAFVVIDTAAHMESADSSPHIAQNAVHASSTTRTEAPSDALSQLLEKTLRPSMDSETPIRTRRRSTRLQTPLNTVAISSGIKAGDANPPAQSPDSPQEQSPQAVTAAEISGQAVNTPTQVHSDNEGTLNQAYSFDNYVVGNGNRFAHAAALAVAEQMAGSYNPLFVYGGVGLGKTHLLHAVGNHLRTIRPNLNVLYLSSEQFINELVFSIREDRMRWFRGKYRNIELLLVDDIQFIARKERTQEEFFHTFNTLYQARKQIVLTSDCPPKKIPTIAEQLRSRFEWGLIADIQKPDLETRVAILKKKAECHGLDLPDDVAIYIATQVRSNIRELEGCLFKIRAFSRFNNHCISLELAKNVLKDLFDAPTSRAVTVELVQRVVASHFQLSLADLISSGRSRRVTLPRQIAMYLSRELTNQSLLDIGRNFGGRDHTTVMHACKKVETTQAQNLEFKENLLQIRQLIQA
ncbi:chromosomal replication initiator protein DnaA [candidate division KSB3 bacterium]|uniref:Chromosomal replication initiator protein DnaA n=1 Tax=candidate division KSB3 bacterium TaxID=2044937 RepID=A0A2G6E3Y4_9BACT|nr:MAG: chromosomal replication initiator protein DnaA [candidate division KSB3 bacterium]PIE28955.1 MAG: chromosomal replication initiator protein DnaA [candidate division KSB3 bacterium]